MPADKTVKDAKTALFGLRSGMTLMSGGFGLCGIPENSIDALTFMDLDNLTVISNNIGNSGKGLVKLLSQNKIKKACCSFIGGNPDLEKLMLAGKIQVDLIPQGTFAERIRAAGMGIRAFYTPTSYGTPIASKKEVKKFDRPCVLETALHADFAIVKAQTGDTYGNLHFKETACNFNPLMAMAAKTTVVEVEELLPVGQLPPEKIHLPGVFVQRIYQGKNYRNDIEFEILDETSYQ